MGSKPGQTGETVGGGVMDSGEETDGGRLEKQDGDKDEE